MSGVWDGGGGGGGGHGVTFKGQHVGDLCGDVIALYLDCVVMVT